ncbi:MAG: ParA family protein [Clostridia bacterium]|nr:ParA family protein [Clostridia bacterium]
MLKVIAIANQKGGVGKTTTALALFDYLKLSGRKVLFIDTDQQKSATKQFQALVDGEYTLYDVLTGECGLDDAIQHLERGDIVAADDLLGRVDVALEGMKKYLYMRKAIEALREDYDYIILDCPPALNTVLLNNLTACDEMIIPITCEMMSLEGLVELANTVKDVRELTNPNLNVAGMLLIKYKKNTNLTKQLTPQLHNFEALFNTNTYETRIRESVKQSEAHTVRKSIFTYAPNCTTALDYQAFAKEYLGGICNG